MTTSCGRRWMYDIDLEAIAKEIAHTIEKPYSLGGFLEFQPILFGLDRDAAFYRLNFYDRDEGDLLAQYNVRLRPEASYRQGMFWLFARADLRLRYHDQGWDEPSRLFEGYASLKPSPSLAVDLGKTEDGERQNDYRLELRVRYFWGW